MPRPEPSSPLRHRLHWAMLLPVATLLGAALGGLAWSGWLPATALWGALASGATTLALCFALADRQLARPLSGRLGTLLRVIERWQPNSLNKPLAPADAPVADELDALIRELERLRGQLHDELRHRRTAAPTPPSLDALLGQLPACAPALPPRETDLALVEALAMLAHWRGAGDYRLLIREGAESGWVDVSTTPGTVDA